MQAQHAATPNPPGNPRTLHTAAATRVRLKHGFYSSRAVIAGEAEAEFVEFRHDMIHELLPGGPVESAFVDQMILAQWKLKRLWAAQTGVYLRHERQQPADPAASYPEWVAACVQDDNAHTGDLHRLSLEEVRLVNIFHKAYRQFDLLAGMRRKRLIQGAARQELEIEEFSTPGARPGLERRIVPPVTDSYQARSTQNADRRGPVATESAPVASGSPPVATGADPAAPKSFSPPQGLSSSAAKVGGLGGYGQGVSAPGVPGALARRAGAGSTAPTPSTGSTSGENLDRGATPPGAAAGSSRKRSPHGPPSPASGGGTAAFHPEANRARRHSARRVPGASTRGAGADALGEVATPSSATPSSKNADRHAAPACAQPEGGPRAAPGAPAAVPGPRRRRVRTSVAPDSATLTPQQRELERLEAQDDRWRAVLDRKVAAR